MRAIVSRGGRPDLAGTALPRLTAPTLLIVGGLDTQVIELNRMAFDQLKAPKELVIVPGAGHLSNLEAPEAFNAAVDDLLIAGGAGAAWGGGGGTGW